MQTRWDSRWGRCVAMVAGGVWLGLGLACAGPLWGQAFASDGPVARQPDDPLKVDEAGALLAQPRVARTSLQARFDELRLDGGERMGLLGVAWLFEAAPQWWVGPTVVGAATGQRGGFFVLGGVVERRWRLGGPWLGQWGLMLGGGGGGAAPVGGGLMVQPSASLLYDWGGVQSGLTWSRVGFPDGRIGSQQVGVMLQWDGRLGYFDVADLGRTADGRMATGLGMSRLMLTGTSLQVAARRDVPRSTVHLAGVRAEWRQGPGVYSGLEAAAATHGGADGYMELLASMGLEAPASAIGLDSLNVGARVALGLGGGGAVPTGGGTLGKLAAVARWDIAPQAFIGAEAGLVRAASGGYRARYAQLLAGVTLAQDWPERGRVQAQDWSASWQHVGHAARKQGAARSLDTVGIKVSQPVWAQFYLTGQAHSAVAGGAGAYALGLAGAGWATPWPADGWRLSAELLAGAAGGGGVDTQGGAVAQAMFYLGRTVGRSGQVQWGLGHVRSRQGGLSSPVIDISWTQRLGVGAR